MRRFLPLLAVLLGTACQPVTIPLMAHQDVQTAHQPPSLNVRVPISLFQKSPALALQTLALASDRPSTLQISVSGIGMSEPLTSRAPVLNGIATFHLSDVPIGVNRIISVSLLSSDGLVLPGATIKRLIDIAQSAETTISVDWRYHPLAAAVESLIEGGERYRAASLNRESIQELIDDVTQPDGDGGFELHPTLLDVETLADWLLTQTGDPPNDSTAGSIAVSLTGLQPNTLMTVTSNDPVSLAKQVTTNATGQASVTLSPVPPGNWTVTATPGNDLTMPQQPAFPIAMNSGDGEATVPRLDSGEEVVLLLMNPFPVTGSDSFTWRFDEGLSPETAAVTVEIGRKANVTVKPVSNPVPVSDQRGLRTQQVHQSSRSGQEEMDLWRQTQVARIKSSRQPKRSPTARGAVTGPEVGSQRNFWIYRSSGFVQIQATLQASSPNANFYVDDDLSNSAAVTGASRTKLNTSLTDIMNYWEGSIAPTSLQAFGNPSDVDENGKVSVLFSPVINLSTGLQGFFWHYDTQSAASAEEVGLRSNETDMLYVRFPHGASSETAGSYATSISGTIAHELQHLVSWNYHGLLSETPSDEVIWLDEGLSSLAEDLCGFGYNEGEYNRERVKAVLDNIDEVSLVNWTYPSGSDIRYGSSYLFARYLADRYGEDVIRAIAQNSLSGHENVMDAIARYGERAGLYPGATASDRFAGLFQDWAAALYLSQSGATTDPRFGFSSIDLRGGLSSGYGPINGPEIDDLDLDNLGYNQSLLMSGTSFRFIRLNDAISPGLAVRLAETSAPDRIRTYVLRRSP